MKSLTLLLTLCFSLVLGSSLMAQDAAKKVPKPANPAMAPIEDVEGLPRVLLIGDSISIGYTLTVREELEGVANVHRIPANGGPTSRGLASIDKWLGDGKWDLIHFNWGIHDLRHMEDGKRQVEPADYEANLRQLVDKLQATGAKLVWASITPIPEGKLNPDRTFGKVPEYNAIAAKVMEEKGVQINDLYSHIMPQFDQLHKPADLHYLPEGSVFLGKKVAQEIRASLGE